ncbi:MAG TPA: hypothetical protein VGD01_18135 [Candidatus Elarobacter sp.]|jgi:hypothetical protein
MARPRRGLAPAAWALAAIALALAASPPVPALALRKLHIDALGMRADRTRVNVGEVFHLAIHARVRERVGALDELIVPDVGTMQLLGDERSVTSAAGGTDVVETLTLEPVQSGTFTFAGAYLDVLDARSGKPTRFSANPVRVVVESPGAFYGNAWSALRSLLIGTAVALAAVLASVAVAIALVRTRRRRQPPAAPAAPVAVAAPPPSRTPRDVVADALRAYRTSPANGSLMALRNALFAAAGARAGATLRDALAATPDHGLRTALIAAERAAFGPDFARGAASLELIDSTESWLR